MPIGVANPVPCGWKAAIIRALAGRCAYCSVEGFFGVNIGGFTFELAVYGLYLSLLVAFSSTSELPDELDVISVSGCLAGETKRGV